MNMSTEMMMEEFSNDHIIVKGKRTKRPRPSSSTSSTTGGSADSLLSSPTSSSGISTSTEEDEDLANCLILLARGGLAPQTESKLTTRRFSEMAATATANAKAGIYVYQCKTCSRTFPSFQALGGHRASHKKPKAAADFDRKRSPPPPPPQVKEVDDTVTPPPSSHVENKPKIHECSICGSEFASGQALGGHMRRHRSSPTISTAAAVEKSDDGDHHHHQKHRVVERTRNLLSLDLNLPAPPEDERREAEFRAFPSNQQPRLVFAAAALVDCHY